MQGLSRPARSPWPPRRAPLLGVAVAAVAVCAVGLGACRAAPNEATAGATAGATPPGTAKRAPAVARVPGDSAASAHKDAPPDADSTVNAAADAADAAIIEIKAAARKRLAADRAAVANRLGFEQALEHLARDARMTRMYERIPDGVIDPEALGQALVRYAKGQGVQLSLADVTLGASPPGEAVPLEYRGDHPYPYTEHQLLEPLPISVRLRGAGDAAVERFYRLLPGGVATLVDLTARRREGPDTVLSGAIYRWRDVTPPRHR